MKNLTFNFFLGTAIFILLPGLAAAQTATWDLNTATEYTLSDDTKSELDGIVAKLRQTNLSHEIALLDDGTTELAGAAAIEIVGDYAYIAAFTDDGIEVVDISDPTAPISVGRILDDATTELNGAWDMQVVGNYLYVTGFTDNGLEILDITNPISPVHVGALSDSGATELLAASGIQVSGNYAYIAGFTDDGLEVVDISNPALPVHAGSLLENATTSLDGAFGVELNGNYAYVTAYNNDAIQVVDITDPLNPAHVTVVLDNATTELNGPRDMEIIGNYLYVAGLLDNGIEVLDITNPALPVHHLAIADTVSLELSGAAELHVSGDYLYVGAFFDDGVQIFNISDPSNPIAAGSITDNGTTALDGVVELKVSGDYLFTTNRSNNSLQVLSLGYATDIPYVTANNATTFTASPNTFTETLGAANVGSMSYQISSDAGVTWNYWNGAVWTSTILLDGTETSTTSDLNTNISSLGAGDYLWRGYFNSSGSQQVELDNVVIATVQQSSSKGGSGVRWVCKDLLASNYTSTQFGRHNDDYCDYKKLAITEVLGSGSCTNDKTIREFLRNGTRNGEFDTYHNGIVTQVDTLQAHINRILAAQYNQAAGPVDGIFGPLTKQGVERLQVALNDIIIPSPNLVIDGIVGPFTMAAINNSCLPAGQAGGTST